MNLMINALSARRGGGQTYVYQLLQHKPPGLDIHTYLLVDPQFAARLRFPCVEVIPCEWASKSILHRAFWERHVLPRLLRKWRIDVLFITGGILNSRVAQGCATVVTPHNMLAFSKVDRRKYPLGYTRLRLRLMRRAFLSSMQAADLTIAISRHFAEMVKQQLPQLSERLVIIPHGIPEIFRTAGRTDIPRPSDVPEQYILYVSILNVYKHQVEVIQAYHRLRQKRDTPEKLLLVGPEYSWYGKQVRASIKNLGLEQDVILTGPLPYEQLPAYYHHAKVIIFASTCENCPNILLEAMGSGRPLFVSDRPPMPEFAEDAAIYFDPQNPAVLSQKLIEYLDDQHYLQSLGKKAAELAEKYTWERTSLRTFEAIMRIAP